jgi:hypothetical protein
MRYALGQARDDPGISPGALTDLNRLLDDSIAADGFQIGNATIGPPAARRARHRPSTKCTERTRQGIDSVRFRSTWKSFRLENLRSL